MSRAGSRQDAMVAFVQAHPGCASRDVDQRLGYSAAAMLPACIKNGKLRREAVACPGRSRPQWRYFVPGQGGPP